MHIGVITPEYPPYAGGGIGTATEAFVQHLASRHHVDVFAIFPPDQAGYDSDQDKTVHTSEVVSVHYLSYQLGDTFSPEERAIRDHLVSDDLAIAKSWIVGKKLEKFLEQNRLDVIFAVDFQGLASFFLISQRQLSKNRRVPVITTLHTGIRELNQANYLSQNNLQPWEYSIAELEQITLEESDALHSPSRFLADFVTSHFISRTVTIIPYFPPVDILASVSSSTDHSSIAENENISTSFLFIGRLERRKGIRELVQGVVSLLRRGCNIRLTVIGSVWHDEFSGTEYSEEVRRCIPKEYAERIDFKGFVPHNHLINEIVQHDAVVVPSLFDNYPNTCMEAVAAGRVVLVSSLGGMAEIVGADDRTLFDPSDPEDIAKTLEHFLLRSSDERREIYQRQRDFYVVKHDSAILLSCYENLIADVTIAKDSQPVVISRKQTIGIGIPVYNTGPFLDACMESVVGQTRCPDRILVINDGSTDAVTVEKLREWQLRYPIIEVLHQENRGLCATRNRLLDELKTDYLLLFDSDDILHVEYLRRTEQYMENNPETGAVVTWVKRFEGDESFWLQLPFRFPAVLIQNRIVSSVALIRRETIDRELRFHENLSKFTAEDWDFWIGYHKRGNEIALIPVPLLLYRVRKGSKWHTLNYRKFMHIMEHFLDHHSDVYTKYQKQVILRLYAIPWQQRPHILWRVFSSLPTSLQMLLRKNRLVKKLGYLLLTKR